MSKIKFEIESGEGRLSAERALALMRDRTGNRWMVLCGEDVKCVKCHKVILPGRWVYDNGFCYRCERNRVLRDGYMMLARTAKMDKDFRGIISDGL